MCILERVHCLEVVLGDRERRLLSTSNKSFSLVVRVQGIAVREVIANAASRRIVTNDGIIPIHL